MLSIIVAIAYNNVIGKANELPWYVPADLKRFKALTTGHTVVMGRKTYDSIYARLKGPLPNRENIVITHNNVFQAPGCTVVGSLDEALEGRSDQEVFIIGGAQIYEQALPKVDRLYVTEIDADINGDTYFPAFDAGWFEIEREHHVKDEKNQYDYDFVIYSRA